MPGKVLILVVLLLVAFEGLSYSDRNSIYRYCPQSGKSETLDWEKQDPAEVLQTTLSEYLNLYLQNQEVFAPYYGKSTSSTKDKSLMLYRHLCQDVNFKPICKKIRSELLDFFGSRLEKSNLLNPESDFNQAKNDYFDRIKGPIAEIRSRYKLAKLAVDESIQKQIFQNFKINPKIKTHLDFNKAVDVGLKDPKVVTLVDQYRQKYLSYVDRFPGIVLLSKVMQGRIEGNYYEISRDELLLSVEDLTKFLRAIYMRTLGENPDVFSLLESRRAALESKANCSYTPDPVFNASDLTFRPVDADHFQLIQKYHGGEMKLVRLLASGLYQRALWRLRSVGLFEEANGLESWIMDKTQDNRVIKIDALGGGKTITKLAYFPNSIRGVYKPATSPEQHFRGILEWVGDQLSDYKREIAAYRIDRLLNLNYVPITKEVTLKDGIGSLQYFIDSATLARFMVGAEKPRSLMLWSLHYGKEDCNIRMFDWLIGNIDRNLENYLFLDDGTAALIDHGFSFVPSISIKPMKYPIRELVPSRRVYKRLLELRNKPGEIEKELEGFLSPENIHLVKRKVNFLGTHIQKFVEKDGMAKIFAEADDLDEGLGLIGRR